MGNERVREAEGKNARVDLTLLAAGARHVDG